MIRLAYLLVVIPIISANNLFSQINCIAPDSIIEKYKDDADRMALRKIERWNLTYQDSVEIPKIISDSFLNQLISVYNAVNIPERDTVVSLLDIHTFPDLIMRNIVVTADSNLSWMKQLKNGIIPTGYQALDSIIAKYDLTIDEYKTWYNSFFWHAVIFKSQINYNIPALASAFETLPDVYFSEPTNIAGDGNDINDEPFIIVGENFGHNLFYIYGWGDCPAGCTQNRIWWFKTYDDCSVQLVDVFGSPLPFTSIHDQIANPILIRPNPFKDVIWIEGVSDSFEYSISDLRGQNIVSGKSMGGYISNLEGIIPGIYFLVIKENNKISTLKVIKG